MKDDHHSQASWKPGDEKNPRGTAAHCRTYHSSITAGWASCDLAEDGPVRTLQRKH